MNHLSYEELCELQERLFWVALNHAGNDMLAFENALTMYREVNQTIVSKLREGLKHVERK